MRKHQLSETLTDVSEEYIEKSAPGKKPARVRFTRIAAAVAAVLAVAVGTVTVLKFLPGDNLSTADVETSVGEATFEMAPTYPETVQAPTYADGMDYDDYYGSAEYNEWSEYKYEKNMQSLDLAGLNSFFAATAPVFMADNGGENRVYSPVNVYIALAMLAETADGDTRAQLLDILGADTIGQLRKNANAIWLANYEDDGVTKSVMASSLWLNDKLPIKKDTVDSLVENYYSWVFSGKMGSAEFDAKLHDWLNVQTGDLLSDMVDDIKTDPDGIMDIITTLYFKAKWTDRFDESVTRSGVFHSPDGDADCDFMHTSLMQSYYRGDNFGATSLSLDGGEVWLFLPDEGTSPEQLLSDPAVYGVIGSIYGEGEYENVKSCLIHLSMPKFDVSSNVDLVEGLEELGVTDCFDYTKADFSPLIDPEYDPYVSKVEHGARVTVDEEGLTGAAYTVVDLACGASMPEDEIDFVLDRPFLFAVTSTGGTPVFVGVVNRP